MCATLRSAANSTPLGTGPLSEGEGAAHSRQEKVAKTKLPRYRGRRTRTKEAATWLN